MVNWKRKTDYKVPDDVRRHIEKVGVWLKENTLVYEDVKALTLHDFQMDWQKNFGTFLVKFDAQACPMKFSVFIGGAGNGTVSLQIPMFHSPLGAPYSYPAIDIADEVKAAIENALNDIFPRLRPFGLDKETEREVTMITPFGERLPDKLVYEKAKDVVSKDGFQLTINVVSA